MRVPNLKFSPPQTIAALTRLKPSWIDKSTSLSSKIRLMRSLVTSIFLYACESWTLTAALQRRKQLQAKKMGCYHKILHITYKDHVTIKEVRARIQQATGLLFIRSGQSHLARHSERGKKTKQTEEEVGRRHQGMDRPRVRQIPAGKWRKLVAKSSAVS